jgi:hypothetical protein
MSEADLTLADLLVDHDGVDSLARDLEARVLPKLGLPAIVPMNPAADSVAITLQFVLSTPVQDILAGGWRLRQDLLRFRDEALYPPGRVVDYKLDEIHVVSLVRKPSVQLTLDGQTCGPRIDFIVNADLSASSVVLKIQRGRIIGACVGKVWGEGAVKWRDVVLVERQTPALVVGGKYTFGQGVDIAELLLGARR